MADNGKINREKGMFGAAAWTFPFLSQVQSEEGFMNKKRAIQILTKAAGLYHANLENQKILFLYGIPSEVRKQLQEGGGSVSSIKSYEVVFQRFNFQHLTGVQINRENVASANHFYEKCLDNRLMENDFNLAKDGSTEQKLDILERMMGIKKNVTMIGEFTDRGPRLYTEKAAGNVCGCIGFVKDYNTNLNVPNTLLKKDIRDVIASSVQNVYAVISKDYKAEKYSILEKSDKEFNIKSCIFTEEIERILEKEKFT